jgi:molybdopterin-guanine dinucleotide biosynthesis protein A
MLSKETISKSAYPSPLDAIVLAGTDSNPKRMIQGRNKAFLEIGGQVLVRRVVEALVHASSIGQVYVVGPGAPLRQVLEGLPRQVIIVDQVGKMLANSWAAIHAAEARYFARHGTHDPARPMLFISCDLPLISAQAVDDFVSRCAHEDNHSEAPYSMLTGVAEEVSLKPYYPENGAEGITRPCVHLSSGCLRLANIYVGRPRKLSHQDFLQTGFSYRKAKDWHNVMSLVWNFFKQSGGWKAAWLTLRLQVTLMLSRNKGRLYHRLREGNTPKRVELATGIILGGSIRIVVSPYGGLSLDVDEEEDYRILSQRFSEWSDIDPASGDV